MDGLDGISSSPYIIIMSYYEVIRVMGVKIEGTIMVACSG
jgi:hypothetical protein